jgi:hypothetical protein
MPSIAATVSAFASAVGAVNLDFMNELKDFEVAAGIGFSPIPGT